MKTSRFARPGVTAAFSTSTFALLVTLSISLAGCASPGYQLQPPPDGFDSWDAALEAFGVPRDQWNSRSAIVPLEGVHPRIFCQRVPEGKVVKNRVYLDVRIG